MCRAYKLIINEHCSFSVQNLFLLTHGMLLCSYYYTWVEFTISIIHINVLSLQKCLNLCGRVWGRIYLYLVFSEYLQTCKSVKLEKYMQNRLFRFWSPIENAVALVEEDEASSFWRFVFGEMREDGDYRASRAKAEE